MFNIQKLSKSLAPFVVLSLIFSLFLSIFYNPVSVRAVPVYDQTNGTYTDTLVDNSGIPTRNNADVNISTQVLQLTNASNGFTAPFYTSGYAITSSIYPTSVAKWNSVTFASSTPTNTSVKIQFLDNNNDIFPDAALAGNSTGFSSSPIDISSLPPLQIATNGFLGNAKDGRLKLKITLATTDTAVTPTINNLQVSWTVKQGDLSATTFDASTFDWAAPFVNQQATLHTTTSNPQTYAAFRWASDKLTGYSSSNKMFVYNQQLISSAWFGSDSLAYLRSYNTDAGTFNWKLPFNGRGYFSIGQNGTGYQSEYTNDIFTTIDLNLGISKWTYGFDSGHGNDNVIIGSDGTTYTIRNQNQNNVLNIYAFNPDGSTKWTQNITVVGGTSVMPGAMSLAADGTLYFGTFDYSVDIGRLYTFNPTTQSIMWSYQTGNSRWYPPPLVGTDGTIYIIGDIRQGLYAINSNGTLKWHKSYGQPTDAGYASLSLRSDGVLLANRITDYSASFLNYNDVIQAIDADTGALIWSKDKQDSGLAFTDSSDNVYAPSIDAGSTSDDWTATVGYYDKNFDNKWKVVWPFSDIDGENWVQYHFINGQNIGSSIISDGRGWLYGSFTKKELVSATDLNPIFNQCFTQYFAMAPWTLSVSGFSGNVISGGNIRLSATTSMQQTNPLLDGDNKVQAIMDNGDKVAMTYSSTDNNGDTVWSGDYTIPTGMTSGDHTFTVEASQSYMQTDVVTHFDTPTTESGNTGIVKTGFFYIDTPTKTGPGSSIIILPETGADQ